MYLKELIVDGFKSYANRTVVSGWDPEFNAITGLNGTGKSNLLDAICFVLGLSNLSSVRASGPQDLIYKQGQSRVSRASVTLVFDNSDKGASPVGYEECGSLTVTRQVVVGGRGKYLINGHTAQLARVQSLFHSVGLNVNNPHFLIMQGRITRVCSMRPAETLGLLEEAAGTAMFEQKKQAALKTIAKKQAKVDEISRIMDEEIQPVLDQLRSEKANFYKFNANKNEIENLQRIATAQQHWSAQKRLLALKEEESVLQASQAQLASEVEAAAMSVEIKQKELKELTKKREADFDNNPAFQRMEQQGAALSKTLVQATTQWQNAVEAAQTEQKELKKLQKAHADAAKGLESKQKEAAAAEIKAQQASKEHARLTQAAADIRSAQLGIVVGNNKNGEGSGGSDTSSASSQGGFAGQLMAAQRSLAEEEGAAKSAATRLRHVLASLKESENALKGAEKAGAALAKEIATKQTQHDRLKAQIQQQEASGAGGNGKEGVTSSRAAKEARLSQLREEVASLSYEIDALEARLGARLRFEFNARSAGISPAAVKGLVARLLSVKQPSTHSTAVELTAGGKMFNVVVDTEETGKALLEKGQLRSRATLIPLNKITARGVAPAAVAKAESLAAAAGPGASAQLALSTVSYDPEVEAAMRYVFGQSLVVSEGALASRVCFHPEVRTKCVSLDGDVYDPSGAMEGGSLPAGPPLLAALQSVSEKRAARDSKNQEIESLATELTQLASNDAAVAQARQQLDVVAIELKALKQRQESSEHYGLQQSAESARTEAETLKTQAKESEERRHTLKTRISELETFVKELEGARAEKGAALEKRLQSLAKETAAAAKAQAEQAQRSSLLALAAAELQGEQNVVEANIARLEGEGGSIGVLTAAVSSAQAAVESARASFDQHSALLSAEKAKHSALDSQAARLAKEIASLVSRRAEAELEAKKGSGALARAAMDKADASKALSRLEKEHAWLSAEKHLFGQAGSEFDFVSKEGLARASEQMGRLRDLQLEQEALSRRVNPKALSLFERAERESSELNAKRAIILDDKAQIETVLRELDVEKTRALEATWKCVSASLGAIFSALLPGASATLGLAGGEAAGVMGGLELRVSFGGVAKESLSELSGGQRSLLALSLILALLKYKPAPLYILDEIDAALDLSHTQNIGHVLKTHFGEAQFIVVSLKEGMFNHANVLFRTKFVDGVSAVVRTQNAAAAAAASKKLRA